MYRNFGLKTIEEDIMVALKKLDIINEDEFLKQQLVHFQRAARTDKGVSALRQVINLTMSKCLPRNMKFSQYCSKVGNDFM